jgi:hypothetical protein
MNARFRAANPWQIVVVQDHTLLIVIVDIHMRQRRGRFRKIWGAQLV